MLARLSTSRRDLGPGRNFVQGSGDQDGCCPLRDRHITDPTSQPPLDVPDPLHAATPGEDDHDGGDTIYMCAAGGHSFVSASRRARFRLRRSRRGHGMLLQNRGCYASWTRRASASSGRKSAPCTAHPGHGLRDGQPR
jgi:hypothetical protein